MLGSARYGGQPCTVTACEEDFPNLARVAITPWKQESGIKVLGLPVCLPGDSSFAEKLVKEAVAKLEEALCLLNKVDDRHCQHLLLRFCLD